MENYENKKDVLYRYQPFNKYSESFFAKRLLHFVSPKDFNDPYDCKVVFPSVKNDNDIRSLFRSYFQKKETIGQSFLTLCALKTLLTDPKKKNELLEPILAPIKSTLNSLGILCLSEENKDILMWSHYSDGHRGYCLEFNKDIFSKFGFCNKITYRNTYPSVVDFHSKTTTVRDLFVFNKSKHWEYEKEWRTVLDPSKNPSTNSRFYEYPEELLTGIIFGCEMSQENREKISDWLKNRRTPIKYYEAIKKDYEYGLDIVDFNF